MGSLFEGLKILVAETVGVDPDGLREFGAEPFRLLEQRPE